MDLPLSQSAIVFDAVLMGASFECDANKSASARLELLAIEGSQQYARLLEMI